LLLLYKKIFAAEAVLQMPLQLLLLNPPVACCTVAKATVIVTVVITSG